MWTVEDGGLFHVFFLHAPHALGDESRRHRAARIGHAVSADLRSWRLCAEPFGPGEEGSFDSTATWTGSVVRGQDGRWRMFYTGSRFLNPEPDYTNIETVGVAVSDDLMTWHKEPGPVTRADPRWYETLGGSSWREEAWRDPWVFRDPQGDGWHMLVTARANHGPSEGRGVIGYATSPDLEKWTVRPPLSTPGAGFAHLEVPQVAEIAGSWFLLFGCGPSELSSSKRAEHPDAGMWMLPLKDPTCPYDVSAARPLTDSSRYCGRLVESSPGTWELLTFENGRGGEDFTGVLNDPLPIALRDGWLAVATTEVPA